jgi:hypothetical protein
MHRTAAAVLSGATHITITDAYPESDTELLEATLTLPYPADPNASIDDLFGILRSFPGSHHWVTTDVLSATHTHHPDILTLTAVYYCHAAHASDLATTITARAAHYGYVLTIAALSVIPDE